MSKLEKYKYLTQLMNIVHLMGKKASLWMCIYTHAMTITI